MILSSIRRSISVSLSLALLVACSSSKTKDDPPAPEPDATHDAEPPAPKPPECHGNPIVLTFDPTETGFASCDIGAWHRTSQQTCPTRPARPSACGFAPVDGGKLNAQCRLDSDCTDPVRTNGYCTVSSANAACHCEWGCTTDADCGPGKLCECGDPMGKCVTATCLKDADCGGMLCLRSRDPGCGTTYACQAPTDACTSNSDCKAPLGACMFENGARTCQAIGGCR